MDAEAVGGGATGPLLPFVASRAFVPAELATLRIFPLVCCALVVPFLSFGFGVSDLVSSCAARDVFGAMAGCWFESERRAKILGVFRKERLLIPSL